MRKHLVILSSALILAFAAAPTLFADDNQKSPDAQSERRMRGQDGMMSRDGMIGMMGMMQQMSRMRDHCASMMQDAGSSRPNEQWRPQQ
jgi:hypothetical protein